MKYTRHKSTRKNYLCGRKAPTRGRWGKQRAVVKVRNELEQRIMTHRYKNVIMKCMLSNEERRRRKEGKGERRGEGEERIAEEGRGGKRSGKDEKDGRGNNWRGGKGRKEK